MNAIRLSFDKPEKWLNPFASTVGLIFLGTPFRGRHGMSFTDMVKAAILTTSEERVWPESLEHALPGNEFLIQTVRQFLDARKRDYPIPIYCFYETFPSDVGQVVKSASQIVSSLSDYPAMRSVKRTQINSFYRNTLYPKSQLVSTSQKGLPGTPWNEIIIT
jgi:hypothetical protein